MSTNVEGQSVSSRFLVGDLTQFGVITYLSEENGMAEIKSNEQELYYDYSSKSYKFRSPVYHVKIWRLRRHRAYGSAVNRGAELLDEIETKIIVDKNLKLFNELRYSDEVK